VKWLAQACGAQVWGVRGVGGLKMMIWTRKSGLRFLIEVLVLKFFAVTPDKQIIMNSFEIGCF
jgi:hypothetical protein